MGALVDGIYSYDDSEEVSPLKTYLNHLGDSVRAKFAALAAAEPVWANYTPTCTGFTVSATRARWISRNKLVTVQARWTINAVSANIRISLPVPAAAGAVDLVAPVGIGVAHGGSTILGDAFLASTTTIGFRHSTTSEWGSAAPLAWATGNELAFTIAYEAA